MTGKLFAIVLSLMILGQASLLRGYVGTWIFPACIFGLFWFCFTFIPLIFQLHAPVEPLAVAYILAACLIFSGTALFFRWKDAYRGSTTVFFDAAFDSLFMRSVFFGMSLIATIATITNWILQGFSLHEITMNFFETGNEYLKRKYEGDISSNFASKMSVAFAYPVAILGGIIFSSRRYLSYGVLVVAASFAAPVLAMAIEGNKGAFFLAAALFWGGTLVVRIGRGENYILTKNGLIGIAIGAVVMIPVLISAFWIRMIERVDNFDQALLEMLWYFYSYTCGHLYAFSDWFSHLIGFSVTRSYSNDLGSDGFYTFMGIFRLLGDDRQVISGVFPEYFVHLNVMQSNIFTIFRGLITDFGLYGALIFWFIAGLIVHVCFKNLILAKYQALAISIFVHFVGFAYSSFIVSFFMWNSIYVSFIITAFILQINIWVNREKSGAYL